MYIKKKIKPKIKPHPYLPWSKFSISTKNPELPTDSVISNHAGLVLDISPENFDTNDAKFGLPLYVV